MTGGKVSQAFRNVLLKQARCARGCMGGGGGSEGSHGAEGGGAVSVVVRGLWAALAPTLLNILGGDSDAK